MNSILDARRIEAATLPVIDVSGLSSSKLEDRKIVGAAIRAACIDNGFFYCSGHGIPQGLIDAVLAQTKALFDQPAEAKRALEKSEVSNGNCGYETFGAQTLDAAGQPDHKEAYYIGLELPEDDERVMAGRFDRCANVWPKDLPGFRQTMSAYYQAMRSLSELLMDGIALSLDLPEDYFDSYKQDPIATARLHHYPPQRGDVAPNEIGAGAHTDWGALTLLLQDDVGGLQVYDKENDDWIHADPLLGTFVVNLGYALTHWTNDLYKSTRHRVVNASGRERYSVAFFYDGEADYEIVCIPTCLASGETPKYAPITVEGNLMYMYNKTYG